MGHHHMAACTSPHGRLHTPHPQLLSMKECSGKKVPIAKVSQNDPLYLSTQKNNQVDSKIKDKG